MGPTFKVGSTFSGAVISRVFVRDSYSGREPPTSWPHWITVVRGGDASGRSTRPYDLPFWIQWRVLSPLHHVALSWHLRRVPRSSARQLTATPVIPRATPAIPHANPVIPREGWRRRSCTWEVGAIGSSPTHLVGADLPGAGRHKSAPSAAAGTSLR